MSEVEAVTAIRARLAEAVRDLPGETRVTLGPTSYGSSQLEFRVMKTVGDSSPETEMLIDEMFRTVPEAIEAEFGPTAYVTKCGGHQFFQTSGPRPELGCSWTVTTLT